MKRIIIPLTGYVNTVHGIFFAKADGLRNQALIAGL